MSLCMTSVAATYKGKVVVGGIYDLHGKEVFYTVRRRGGGRWTVEHV
jgi:fructose-1,6-bisphosphatase/inositol monophosphatase family enzyme